ncbi:MAG TPA: metallophosphoesterase [Longimicrobium sp.]|nr:metallophosphoesterase [Longimicrobium sp.]
MPPSTMILRFRDLSTAEGDTLRLHADQIQKHGHVWWGWWAKAGERVPPEVFGALLQRARADGGLAVWLFDSGRRQLYRALLRDMEWDLAGEPIAAPEEGKATPGYYNQGGTARYKAWFRFSEISAQPEADPAAVLQSYSYEQVDDFFEHGASRFRVFYGKRIASLEELRQQERTIWFVRDARPDDPQQEIRLLDSHRISPGHFPEQFQQSASLNLLWLSDVHYSLDGHHAFPAAPDAYAKPLADRIEHACQEFGVRDLGGIILSGDLSWRAAPEEFAHALHLIRRLQTWSRLDNYQVAVCPGNHDIPFSTAPWEKGGTVERSPADATREYARFYSELFYLAPNEFLSCGRKFLLGGAVPVELVCLNSSLLWQKKGVFQGHGFVGEDQLQDAARKMGWTERTSEPLPLRIVVVHHHLMPVTFREQPVAERSYSAVLDAEALTRWLLQHHVQVVLHGHMHSPFHTTVERPLQFGPGPRHRLHVFGMGSSGVGVGDLGEVKQNLFGVMKLSREALTMTYYSVDPTNPPGRLAELQVRLRQAAD